MHEVENNYQRFQNSSSSVMYRAAEANGFRRPITPDNTGPRATLRQHAFECVRACGGRAAQLLRLFVFFLFVKMLIVNKNSCESEETSFGSAKYCKKVFYLREVDACRVTR